MCYFRFRSTNKLILEDKKVKGKDLIGQGKKDFFLIV